MTSLVFNGFQVFYCISIMLNPRYLLSPMKTRQAVIVFILVISLAAEAILAEIRHYEFASVKIFPELSGHGVKAHIDTQARHFDVHLDAHPELFSKEFVIDDGNKQYASRDVVSYSGSVGGKYGSTAIGSIANERFEGILFLNGTSEALYLEDGSHLPEVECLKDPFYSSDHPQYCTVAYFGYDEDSRMHHDHKIKRSVEDDVGGLGMCGWTNPKIAASLNEWLPLAAEGEIPKPRERRAPDSKPKVCSLNMQIDTTLWSLYMSDFKNNEQTTRTALTRLVADLVQSVSTIYRLSEFYTDDGTIDKMTGFVFQVSKIRIYKKEEVCASDDKTIKQLCNDYIDSDAFLKINSEMNHDAFCLAYIISHRIFSGGVMGLAWLGYPSGYVGGVCQKQTRVSGGAKSSYNTGIITSNNQGSRVSKRSLMLTLAHEIGHNFGSPHDTASECVPTGSSGYYIMYPYVNPGDKANNDKFSPCSRNKIALNVDSILQNRPGKSNCFKEALAPVCGNQVIEAGEQCDCGSSVEECANFGDRCCTPADAGPTGCKLKPESKCSLSQGPCCSAQCQFLPAEPKQLCAIASECSTESYCDGRSATCPRGGAVANLTLCASSTRRCINGECSQSVCEDIKYESCQEPMVKGTDAANYCFLSCRPPGANKRCISTQYFNSDENIKALLMNLSRSEVPLPLPPGSPCDEFRGVCDPLRRCRQVNVQGPLARMFQALMGKTEIDSPGDWLVKYWWVVAICAVVFIAISFCCLKYCSDLLPTSNPKFEGSLTASKALRNTIRPTLRRRRFGDQPVPTNPPPF